MIRQTEGVMDRKGAQKMGGRLMGWRQESEMDREGWGGGGWKMSARCLFSFDQNNGLFPPHQSH